ncbi:hypothetical protein H9P43_005456 [Blastocladiella emersonii ATCC 22665]|nr:hypothetical protein H9P43_005456 [Blastocladiella emersonii ATCC 22665]
MAHPHLSVASTKWAVFAVATLTALTGLVLIVLGVYTLSDTTSVLGQRSLSVLMLVVGSLVFLVSFLGTFGVVTESRTTLYAFLIGLIALVAVQIVLGVVALANQGAVDSLLDDAWQNAYDHHPRVIRDLQEERGCCGFRYTTDRAVPKTTPDACLKSVEFGYQVSCYRTLVGGYRRLQNVIGTSSIILAGIQLVAVFLTYLLIHNITPKHDDGSAAERQRLLSPDTSIRGTTGTGEPGFPYAYYGSEGPGVDPAYNPSSQGMRRDLRGSAYPSGAIGIPPTSGSGRQYQPFPQQTQQTQTLAGIPAGEAMEPLDVGPQGAGVTAMSG